MTHTSHTPGYASAGVAEIELSKLLTRTSPVAPHEFREAASRAHATSIRGHNRAARIEELAVRCEHRAVLLENPAMRRFLVTSRIPGDDEYPESIMVDRYYMADDEDHAREQAEQSEGEIVRLVREVSAP
jgi:hypothetical protein